MVNELMGLCLGIVNRVIPLDITVCLPSRTGLYLIFRNTRTASSQLIPGMRGMSDGHDFFADFELSIFQLFRIEPFPDGTANIRKRLFPCRALRVTPAK